MFSSTHSLPSCWVIVFTEATNVVVCVERCSLLVRTDRTTGKHVVTSEKQQNRKI